MEFFAKINNARRAKRSIQCDTLGLVLWCALRLHLLCCYNIDLFFWLILRIFFSFKKLQNPNNNKAWNIRFESTHCNDYSILFLPSYLYIVQSLFFPMMTIFSRPFAFFVCFTHVKIIIKHHCDKLKQCLLAFGGFGIFCFIHSDRSLRIVVYIFLYFIIKFYRFFSPLFEIMVPGIYWMQPVLRAIVCCSSKNSSVMRNKISCTQ